jgi:hypothetical protein
MPPLGLEGGILWSAQALRPANTEASRNTLRASFLYMIKITSAVFAVYFTHLGAIPCACRADKIAEG